MNKLQSLPWNNPRFKNWISVARACQLMERALSRKLQAIDLKPPHLDILANLYRFPGISQQDLARKLLVGRSNMSMLLPQLEKRGLLHRKPDASDKRVLRLELTEEGKTLTESALAIQMEVIEISMGAVSLAECDQVGDSMSKLVKRLLEDETA
ncbi:MAG: MarR family winged helix-turn-helix transcriptional regulator [Phyllobacterium sp.]